MFILVLKFVRFVVLYDLYKNYDISTFLKQEKQDQGNDELINGPIEEYLGSRVFTPRDLNETYGGVWPTIRQLKKVKLYLRD